MMRFLIWVPSVTSCDVRFTVPHAMDAHNSSEADSDRPPKTILSCTEHNYKSSIPKQQEHA